MARLLRRYLKIRIQLFVERFRSYKPEDAKKIYARAVKRMKFRPVCPFCGCEMLFRHSTVWFPPYRDDQGYKCPKCFYLALFGLPITKQEFDLERKTRGGIYFCRPSYNRDEYHNKFIRKRLKKLGYIE